MKKVLLFILTLIIVCFCASCVDVNSGIPNSTESYVYNQGRFPTDPSVSSEALSLTESTTLPTESTSEPSAVQESTSDYTVTAPQVPESTSAPTQPSEPSSAPPTQPPVQNPDESTAPEDDNTSVDLTVDLPDANGKMEVDTSPSNKLIASVVSKKKTDAAYLAAVYSVPESGQNYVLEFYEKNKRTKESLRRVYLLDEQGNITSVAAAKTREKENISATENWFCFNVLVKGVIFDAISGKLK